MAYKFQRGDATYSGSLTIEEDLAVTEAITGTTSITAGTSFIIGSADLNEADMEKLDGITNGTAASNSTTVSLVKDSGDALEYEVALSTTGDPGIGGTANSGTGYAASRSINLGTGTLYMRFRHRFKLAFVGNDANVSVTFANTNVSLANKTDLDITMVNTTGGN